MSRVKTGLLVIILVSTGVVGWFLWSANSAGYKELRFTASEPCELHSGPCMASNVDGESIEFSIMPREIPLLKPLQLSVNLTGLRALAVTVVFSGIDVDMGTLAYPLNSTDGVTFEGTASLSVCSSRKMTWQAKLVIEVQGRTTSVPFLFDTEYRSNFGII